MSTTTTTETPPQTAVVQQAVAQSRTFFDRQADAVTTMLAQRVSSVAAELRSTSDRLSENQSAGVAGGLVLQAADYAERVASYLRAADGERLLADAEQLTERNPVLATGIAAVLGLSAARFFKASAGTRRASTATTRRYETGYDAGYGDE